MSFLSDFLKKEKEQHLPSPITDPFKSDKIESIRMVLHTNLFTGEKYWYGTIEFKNNRTTGEYKTVNYPQDEFTELVKDIERTIKTL